LRRSGKLWNTLVTAKNQDPAGRKMRLTDLGQDSTPGRIQGTEGLIQQPNPSRGQQQPRQRDSLLLTFREGSAGLIELSGQLKPR
jgi:hypothetical protein